MKENGASALVATRSLSSSVITCSTGMKRMILTFSYYPPKSYPMTIQKRQKELKRQEKQRADLTACSPPVELTVKRCSRRCCGGTCN